MRKDSPVEETPSVVSVPFNPQPADQQVDSGGDIDIEGLSPELKNIFINLFLSFDSDHDPNSNGPEYFDNIRVRSYFLVMLID